MLTAGILQTTFAFFRFASFCFWRGPLAFHRFQSKNEESSDVGSGFSLNLKRDQEDTNLLTQGFGLALSGVGAAAGLVQAGVASKAPRSSGCLCSCL